MIGRAAILVSCLVTLLAGAGLAVWLEVDSTRGQELFVPVYTFGSDGDLVEMNLDQGPLQEQLLDHPAAAIALRVDPNGTVTGGAAVPAGTTPSPPFVRPGSEGLASRRILPRSTRLAPELHNRVEYALIRVSPGGKVYFQGLADQDRNVLGRGRSPW